MKILHVICSVNPAGGGPIEGVKQLSMVNQRHGHQIEVVSLDAPNASYLKSMSLPVHAMGPGLWKYHYSSRLTPWLRENAKNYDAVIVNGIWQYHSFAVWQALRGSETPYVVFTHGMLGPWFKKTYPLKHFKKLLYWPWGEYRVLRDAQAVLFTCAEERVLARQSFPHLYRCNEAVVGYGTASPIGDMQVAADTFYARYPLLRKKRLAMFIGRIHPIKGCDLLINAFAKVLAVDSSWHLVICGLGQADLQKQLSAMAEQLNISNRITWAGVVSGDLKWGALRASEVFVLPSHHENFGIVVAEALACGVPVLTSNKVNIWREVQEDGAGIIGEDDLDGTCSVLRAWLDMTSEQRTEMRKHALACFQQRFEIHRAATNLLQVLTSVVKGKAFHATS